MKLRIEARPPDPPRRAYEEWLDPSDWVVLDESGHQIAGPFGRKEDAWHWADGYEAGRAT